jgi:outer membrane protein
MKKHIIIYIIVLAFSSACLQAQKKWSLERCIRYALENNTDVKSSALTINANRILVDKSGLDYIPRLNFNTDYQFNVSRSLDANYTFVENTGVNTANTGIYMETVVFDGFRKYNNYRKSLFDLEVSEADFAALKNDLSLSVTMSYMNVLLGREIIHSIKRQIEISESNLQRTNRLLEEGVVTDENLQNILVQLDNEKYSLAEAEGSLKNAIISLCSLLNLKDYDAFETDDSLSFEFPKPLPLSEILSSAMSLPQMKAAKWRVNSSVYALKIAQSDFYPILSFGTSWASSFSDARKKMLFDENGAPTMVDNRMQYEAYPLTSQLKNHRFGLVSVSLSYPVTSFFQTRKNVALARNNILQAQINLEVAEKNLTEHIRQIYSEVETAKKKYDAAQSSVEHTRALLVYADNKLKNGALTAVDYIIIKNNLLISEAQAGKAKYEYFFKSELLKFYLTHETKYTNKY